MAFFADDYSLPHLQQEALVKAAKKGEGSRGGHIIGHTKSGKPIYSIGHKNYQHKESHSDYYGDINPLDSGLSAGHAGTLVQQRFADYSKHDHLDAANAHNEAAGQWRGKHRETLENADRAVHGKLKNSIYHFEDGNRSAGTRTDYSASDNKALDSAHAAMTGHEAAAVAHLQAVGGQSVKKSQHGEGARGGHIIGHTKSGKPIYEASGSKYAHIKDNESSSDHRNGAGTRRSYPKFTLLDHDDAYEMHLGNDSHHTELARRSAANGRHDLEQAHYAIAGSHTLAAAGHKYARQLMQAKGHDYPRHIYHEAGMSAEMDKKPIQISDYGEVRNPFNHNTSDEESYAREHNRHAVAQNFGHFSLKQHQNAIEHHEKMSHDLYRYLGQPSEHKTGGRRLLSDKKVRHQMETHSALGLAHRDYANKKFSKTGV